MERASFKLLLQIQDEWTDQPLTLRAINEAGLQCLLEAGLIEAVIEVTVSFPTRTSGLKTSTDLRSGLSGTLEDGSAHDQLVGLGAGIA